MRVFAVLSDRLQVASWIVCPLAPSFQHPIWFEIQTGFLKKWSNHHLLLKFTKICVNKFRQLFGFLISRLVDAVTEVSSVNRPGPVLTVEYRPYPAESTLCAWPEINVTLYLRVRQAEKLCGNVIFVIKFVKGNLNSRLKFLVNHCIRALCSLTYAHLCSWIASIQGVFNQNFPES